jgi:hypothetical protein
MKLKTILPIVLASVCFSYLSAAAFEATFIPRIQAKEEYTDNVDLDRNNKQDDFITTVTPGFTAGLKGKTAGMELSADPGYSFYANHSEKDDWNVSSNFNAWANTSKNTRLEVRDYFYLTSDPLSDRDVNVAPIDPNQPPDTTVRKGRNQYYRNNASGNFIYQFGKYDSLNLGFMYRRLDNSKDRFYEDNQGYIPSMQLDYWFTSHFGSRLIASYTRGTYDQSDNFTGTPTDNFDSYYGNLRMIRKLSRHLDGFVQYEHTRRHFNGRSHDYMIYNPSVGFTYQVLDHTNLEAYGGYFYRDVDSASNNQDPSGSLSLTQQFNRGSLYLNANGGYQSADFTSEANGYTQYYEGRAAFNYQLARRVNADIFGSYRRDKYKDASPSYTNHTSRAGAGLVIQPLNWLFVRFEYSFRNVSSRDNSQEYTENRGLVRFTLTPPRPFRTVQ